MSGATFLFLFIFFVSGFAALLYQIIWQRMLTFFGGADVYAVTIVVSAFMGGLGFGSLAGGHVADRLGARGRLLAFASCELAIAVFAALSATIYYDVLYVGIGATTMPRAGMAAIIFVVTLWPTFFMGMSLPLLARAMTQDAGRPARWVPILYGWNTFGAACGSLFAAAILFRTFDFATSVRIGAGLSFGCAVAALAGALYVGRRTPGASDVSPNSPALGPARDTAGPRTHFRLPAWIVMYSLSGFVALSLEIVWFRILGVLLKANSFTFGHLLAVFLAGVGLGALAGNSRPARSWAPAEAFLLLQAGIPIVAVALLGAFVMFVGRIDLADPVWQYLGRYETLSTEELSSSLGLVLALYVVLPIGLLGLPTLMMGVSFGHLQRAVQTDLAALGRRVGWLQTANIVGSMLGAMLTGLVLLDGLGTAGTLRLLVSCSVVFLLLFVQLQPGGGLWRRRAAAIALVAAAMYATPSATTLWSRLHGTAPDQVIHAEDSSGLSVLKSLPDRTTTVLHANGLGQSVLPYGGFHTVLGALPVLIHPAPVAVAVIGLGSGDTVFGIGGRPETRTIDSIEIIEAELKTLRLLDQQRTYPALRMLLQDTRVHHWFTDGRMFLRRGSRRYDVIEADALRPTSAYSGNLYSVEYFELLRDRLNAGGLAVTWTPTPRVIDTFVKVFPHVLVFRDDLAVGGIMPVSFDRQAIADRLRLPVIRDYYQRGDVDIETLLAPYLRHEPRRYGPEFDRGALVDVNRDLFPKDEFAIAYRGR
jgi:spermidine synthase